MKRLLGLLSLALLTACAGYSYPVQDGGDGVYYAASPPNVTYVNVPYSPARFYAMPYWTYHSPYFYPYYFSIAAPSIEPYYASPNYWARNRPYYLPPSSRSPNEVGGMEANALSALYSTGNWNFRHSEPLDLRGAIGLSSNLRPTPVNNRTTRQPVAAASAFRRPVTVPSSRASRPASTRMSSSSRSHRQSSSSRPVSRGSVSRPKIHHE